MQKNAYLCTTMRALDAFAAEINNDQQNVTSGAPHLYTCDPTHTYIYTHPSNQPNPLLYV